MAGGGGQAGRAEPSRLVPGRRAVRTQPDRADRPDAHEEGQNSDGLDQERRRDRRGVGDGRGVVRRHERAARALALGRGAARADAGCLAAGAGAVIEEALIETLRPAIEEIVRAEVKRAEFEWQWRSAEQAAELLGI